MIGINFIYLSGHLLFDYDLWGSAPEDCEIMGCYVGNCFNIVWAIIFTYTPGRWQIFPKKKTKKQVITLLDSNSANAFNTKPHFL